MTDESSIRTDRRSAGRATPVDPKRYWAGKSEGMPETGWARSGPSAQLPESELDEVLEDER